MSNTIDVNTIITGDTKNDLVAVVRCEDCKHYESKRDVCHNPRFGDGHAYYPPPYVRDDFYCADGERRAE